MLTPLAAALLLLASNGFCTPAPAEIAVSPDPQYLVFWQADVVFGSAIEALTKQIERAAPAWARAGGEPRTLAPLRSQAEAQVKSGDLKGAESTLHRILAVVAPGLQPAAAAPETVAVRMEQLAARLAERLGARGDGETRQLAFGLSFAPLMVEDQIPGVIREAFRAAERHDLAVAFSLDSHYFWQNRPDLWQDPENVEWSDWHGKANRARYLDWGAPQKLAPHMCYNSPALRREIARLAGRVIAPAILSGMEMLKAKGKPRLFAGLLVDSEPSVDDYTQLARLNARLARFMDDDGAARARLGYHALHNLGYGPGMKTRDFKEALALVNRDFIAFWARQFVEAGIPASRLYTHVPAQGFAFGDPVVDYTNAPAWIAFNPYSRPGWTTYALRDFDGYFQPLYGLLAGHGNPSWGGVEANVGFGGRRGSWESYLWHHFGRGAKFVGVNTGATSAELTGQLERSAFSPEALAAYRRFLSGAALRPE